MLQGAPGNTHRHQLIRHPSAPTAQMLFNLPYQATPSTRMRLSFVPATPRSVMVFATPVDSGARA